MTSTHTITVVKLTPAQRRALEIVRDNPDIRPRIFANLMWPDSEGHRHHTKCGPRGSTRGGGMRLSAGGYLGKLSRAGLLVYTGHKYGSAYVISRAGEEALKHD